MTRRPLDAYPTPARLTEALLRHVPIAGHVLEPCAGAGLMADSLQATPGVGVVYRNDISPGYDTLWTNDATDPRASMWKTEPDWVVTNPPYNEAAAILANAYRSATIGVAFLLRLSFLEPTNGRRDWLQAHRAELSDLLIFGSPRPSFTDNGRTDSATVAWMVWRYGWRRGTAVRFVTGWDGRDEMVRRCQRNLPDESCQDDSPR